MVCNTKISAGRRLALIGCYDDQKPSALVAGETKEMRYTKRQCDNCGDDYHADNRNLKRGGGLCCSKSCAASKREKDKPGYNADRVRVNNARRYTWNSPRVVGGSERVSGRTSEGYRIMDGIAYNEFDEAMYSIAQVDDDDRGWDSHKG